MKRVGFRIPSPDDIDYARIRCDFEGAHGRQRLAKPREGRHGFYPLQRALAAFPGLGAAQANRAARWDCTCIAMPCHRRGGGASIGRAIRGRGATTIQFIRQFGNGLKLPLRPNGSPFHGRPKSAPRNPDKPNDDRAIARRRFLDPPAAIPPSPKFAATRRTRASNPNARPACTRPTLMPKNHKPSRRLACDSAAIRYSASCSPDAAAFVPSSSPLAPRPCSPPSTSSPPPPRSTAPRRS